MKTRKTYRIMLLAFAFLFTGAMVMAQTVESDEAKKKAQMEAEISAAQEAEKRAALEKEMEKKKQMLEEQRMQMKLKQMEMEEQERQMREMEKQHAEQARSFETQARDAYRESSRARSSSRSTGVYTEPRYVTPMLLHQNQSQLTLRNSFKGGTDSTEGEFDVDSGTRQFRCMISGKVNSGDIEIRIVYPGGKVFKDLTINSSAEISFNQSMTIREGEEDKYIGAWGYEVKANKAEGSYMLQIMTN